MMVAHFFVNQSIILKRKILNHDLVPANCSKILALSSAHVSQAGLKLLESKRICYTPKSMSRFKAYLIGRHSCCDFRLDDPSVSRKHAEVVPLADGRFYLTDRNSTCGTFVLEGGNWKKIRQAFVGPNQNLRLGRREINVAEFDVLLTKDSLPNKVDAPEFKPPQKSIPKNHDVRRNPETGEVMIQPSDE